MKKTSAEHGIIVTGDPTGVSIPSNLSVNAGSSKTLTATITPTGATSNLTWESSDTSIATVSGGKVTGVKPGTATITVKTANGYKDTCKVTVTNPGLKLVSSSRNNKTIELVYNVNLSKASKFADTKLYSNTAKKDLYIKSSIDGKKLIVNVESSLYSGHSYTLTVPVGAVKSIYGDKSSSDNKFEFTKGNLKFQGVTLKDKYINPNDNEIQLNFSDKVAKGSQWWRIKLYNSSGVLVEYSLKDVYGNNKSLKLVPKTKLDYHSEYTLEIRSDSISCGGVDWEGSSTTKFTTSPDPNKAYKPEISVNQNMVSMKSSNGEKIFYTLDGSDPTAYGKHYTSPIRLTSSTVTVKAVTRKNSKFSDTVTKVFKFDGLEVVDKSILGGELEDYFSSVAATSDGGYIAAGKAHSTVATYGGDWGKTRAGGGTNGTIAKYTASGTLQWKDIFGGEGTELFNGVTEGSDGYVAVGYTYDSFGKDGDLENTKGKGGTDALIVKYDKKGNVV